MEAPDNFKPTLTWRRDAWYLCETADELARVIAEENIEAASEHIRYKSNTGDHIHIKILNQYLQSPRGSVWSYMQSEYRHYVIGICICYAIIIAVICVVTYALCFM